MAHRKGAYSALGVHNRRYARREAYVFAAVLLAAAAAFALIRFLPLYGSEKSGASKGVLFVGDVMLGRHVETLMNTEGVSYPFKGIRDELAKYSAVVGNFEASVPRPHIHTPNMGFKLAVSQDAIEALARAGFTHAGLANNHAYDFGKEGYDNARTSLAGADIEAAGNPTKVTADDVLYHTENGIIVAIIPVNAVHGTPAVETLRAVLRDTAEKSDIQVMFMHWGDEYRSSANESQRTLARTLIDAGADAIIGHHPHVVQNIEEYRGAPIFYSLGNCIFDQYWNENVQQGLAIALAVDGDDIRYTLIPITSMDTRSQPRPMTRVERTEFLDALASRSEDALADSIREGIIGEPFR